MKLVHLVGFIIKKFVTMHGHMNVKKSDNVVNLKLRYLLSTGPVTIPVCFGRLVRPRGAVFRVYVSYW